MKKNIMRNVLRNFTERLIASKEYQDFQNQLLDEGQASFKIDENLCVNFMKESIKEAVEQSTQTSTQPE